VVLGLLLVAFTGCQASLAEAGLVDSRAPLSAELLAQDVHYLASDELAGRSPGTAGIARAEEYVAKAFGRTGLEPLPGFEDFFIGLPLYRHGYDPDRTALVLDGPGGRVTAELERDFKPLFFSGTGEAEAPLAFAGYGITAPEHGYDDYAGLDVRGRLVLVLRYEPGADDPQSVFEGTDHSRHAWLMTKARTAHGYGAAGMILVSDTLYHRGADDLRVFPTLSLSPDEPPRLPRSAGPPEPAFPVIHLSRATLLAAAGWSEEQLAEAQRKLNDWQPAAEVDFPRIGVRLSVRERQEAQVVPVRNVAALLPGADPELRDEWILVGAHHDHLGAFDGPGDTVYSGADDNASGVAGVLALARHFAARSGKQAPARTLVFMTFTAEEQGLLGSRALVEGQLIPLEAVRFMVNLDMIGRNPERPLELHGSGFETEIREVVEKAGEELGVTVRFESRSVRAVSDFYPFHQRGIPFLSLYTGTHEDYHRPSDTAEKLDYERMERIVGLAARVVESLAAREAPP